MAAALNIIAQVAPAAAVETPLFTATKNFKALAQEIIICNRSGAVVSFRVSISLLGGPTQTKDYILYDLPLYPNNTQSFDLGVTLNAFDAIRVYASTADLTFTLVGAQT